MIVAPPFQPELQLYPEASNSAFQLLPPSLVASITLLPAAQPCELSRNWMLLRFHCPAVAPGSVVQPSEQEPRHPIGPDGSRVTSRAPSVP